MIPWTASHHNSLPFTISQSLLKLMSVESVMPSNHLILCGPFSSCPQSFPPSGSFPVSQLFASGGQMNSMNSMKRQKKKNQPVVHDIKRLIFFVIEKEFANLLTFSCQYFLLSPVYVFARWLGIEMKVFSFMEMPYMIFWVLFSRLMISKVVAWNESFEFGKEVLKHVFLFSFS